MSLFLSEAKPCEDNSKCGKNQHCVIDRLLPGRPHCKCNDDAFVTYYEDCVGECMMPAQSQTIVITHIYVNFDGSGTGAI